MNIIETFTVLCIATLTLIAHKIFDLPPEDSIFGFCVFMLFMINKLYDKLDNKDKEQ